MVNALNARNSASVDSYLGDGAMRFFATGYRNVEYSWTRAAVGRLGHSHSLAAEVRLSHGDQWSVKRQSEQLRPHLSTLDGIALSLDAVESLVAFASHPDGKSRSDAGSSGLIATDVTLVAGNSPDEDLQAVPVFVFAEDHGSSLHAQVAIGSMKADVTLSKGPSNTARGASKSTRTLRTTGRVDVDRILDPRRYLHDGFRFDTYELADLQLDPAGFAAEAVVVNDRSARAGTAGLEADANKPSMLVTFAAGMQLGQILLYQLDTMTRAESNTLWMRRTTFRRRPNEGQGSDLLTVQLEDARVVRLAGQPWRAATVRGSLADLEFECSVTHQLPQEDK